METEKPNKDIELEKQLEGDWESSNLEDQISVIEEEISYTEEILKTLTGEIDKAENKSEKEELEGLRDQTLSEIQSQKEEIKKLRKEKPEVE